jgi:hypothetical protein
MARSGDCRGSLRSMQHLPRFSSEHLQDAGASREPSLHDRHPASNLIPPLLWLITLACRGAAAMQERAETALGHGLITLLKHAPSSACGSGLCTGFFPCPNRSPVPFRPIFRPLPVTLCPSLRCIVVQTLRARLSATHAALSVGRDALIASQ